MKLFKSKPVEFIDSLSYNLFKKHKKAQKKHNIKMLMLKYLPLILLFQPSLIGLILCGVWWLLITIFFDHRTITDFSPTIRIWFGVPGTGKTSMAAWLTRNSIKQDRKVLSNVPIKGSYKLEESDLGEYDMSFDGDGCHVIYDEAVINGLDNRNFKEFSKTKKLDYFSTHRHMNNRVDVFSQGYDIDLKVKDRAEENGLFHLIRSPIRGFVIYKCISKIMFIKKDDRQFIDGFKYKGLPRICYTRSVWDSFDTLDMSLCPTKQKDWEKWA